MIRSKSLSCLFFALLVAGFGLAKASAKAPAAPSNLKVKVLGSNSFQLLWKDNSTNEVGWEIRVGLKGKNAPPRYTLVRVANISSYTIITNDLAGKELDFQMTAFNGAVGLEKFSKPTSIVRVRALSPARFAAPTLLTATAIDDGQIRIGWKDNSTSENGYQLDFRIGKAAWKTLGNVGPGRVFSIPASGFSPSTTHSFRVRAFKANPDRVSSYSNVATVKTKVFQAPTNLVVTPESDGAFSFKWKDTSSIESGFELERKVGTGVFDLQGTLGANASSTTPVNGFLLDTAYQFRLRAFRFVGMGKVYSDYSNIFSAKSTTLPAPTSIAGKGASDSSINLTWKDASARETSFEIEHREVGTLAFTTASVSANTQTYTIPNLKPGKSYECRVRAADFFSGAKSSYTPVIQVLTKDGISGDMHPPIFYQSSFVYDVVISRASALSNLAVTGLPAGLVFDPTLRKISGIPTEDGVKSVSLQATFNDTSVVTRTLVLRIIRPPAAPLIVESFTPVEVTASGSSNVSLIGKFSDPDTTSAVRIATSMGNFDIILYSLATPLTVDNFLDYVDATRYDNTFFHRSVASLSDSLSIIQGGGYGHGAGGFTSVSKNASVANEPGISNLEGTVAMAKVGGSPNSATSEFFVNVSDVNASNLDEQNEGFTVFGRVPDAGMAVVFAINGLPTNNYQVQIGSNLRTLESVPMNAAEAPAVMDSNLLVKVTSVTAAPILQYEALSQNLGVATASISGTDITIHGVASGSTTVRVKATDLDGTSTTQDIAVTVP
jgi:cyclophilin family peptidyl-prolyl cis-trans isomerase